MKSGEIFWAKSEGVAEEERGRHPWIVLSSDEVSRHGGLVIAVPVTSNPTRYKKWDVYLNAAEIVRAKDVRHPLDPEKLEGVVKCAKIRHWSVVRVDEVIGRATAFFVTSCDPSSPMQLSFLGGGEA
jgi:mRNA-degrading endonuclease toxin of MazEF toxin-antitoxin module